MLKAAVLSDTHLGFGIGTERENDCYENFEQATRLALKEGAQLVLLCGDIFHDKIPRQEVLGKAIEIFTRLNKSLRSEPKLLKRVKSGNVEVFKELAIPPVIAIWGTHERRHIGSTNPVQLLEKAGLLACLHTESILVECNSDRIGIHGLSGIPEQYAKDAMKAWNPKPFEDCSNILMIHQNIKEIMPPVDFALEFSDFPKDFIALCGHIHNTSQHRHPISKNPIIAVGSTVSTQLQKIESEIPKGFYVFEFGREKYDYKFMPIKTRPFFYETLQAEGKKPAEILSEIEKKISEFLAGNSFSEKNKPIIRIKLAGMLAQGFRQEDFGFGKIISEFGGRAILSLDKSNLSAADSQQGSRLLEDLRDRKLSIDEIGIQILEKNLGINIGAEKLGAIFHLLAEEEIEQAELAIDGKFVPKIEMPAAARTEAQAEQCIAAPEIAKEIETVQARDEIINEKQTWENKIAPQTQPQKQETQRQATAPPPESVQIAESGLSLLASSNKMIATSRKPQAAQQLPQIQRPQAYETNHLAKSGLSRLASSGRQANNVSRTIERSSRFATIDTMPAPKISDLAEQKLRQEKEKEKAVLTQGGKISSGAVEFGLSTLANSDKKAPPSIRLKEGQNLKTISVVKGAAARPQIRVAESTIAPQQIVKTTVPVSKTKEKFDLQKYLDKEF